MAILPSTLLTITFNSLTILARRLIPNLRVSYRKRLYDSKSTLTPLLITPASRSREFARPMSQIIDRTITRETFIADNLTKIAVELPTMFVFGDDGETVKEVPVPASIKATGTLPEGFTIDFALDPSAVVSALAKQDITTEDLLGEEAIKDLKATINSPDNIKIVPISLHQKKRELETASYSESPEE